MIKLKLDVKEADLSEWDRVVDAMEHPRGEVTVAMVGKYVDHTDAYKSLNEALFHGSLRSRTRVRIKYVDSEEVERQGPDVLGNVDAILVPGGFGERGFEGKVAAVRHARENDIPYLGICLGMQAACIDFARSRAGFEGANSTEFDRDCAHPVIALITEWRDATGRIEHRDEASDLGGTMRLGGQECRLESGSLARRLYGKDVIVERHRHRFEFNNVYREPLEKAGLVISGVSTDGLLVEMVELRDHPWFVGCQFHPEFTSTPRDGHPLFEGFITAALERREGRPAKAATA